MAVIVFPPSAAVLLAAVAAVAVCRAHLAPNRVRGAACLLVTGRFDAVAGAGGGGCGIIGKADH